MTVLSASDGVATVNAATTNKSTEPEGVDLTSPTLDHQCFEPRRQTHVFNCRRRRTRAWSRMNELERSAAVSKTSQQPLVTGAAPVAMPSTDQGEGSCFTSRIALVAQGYQFAGGIQTVARWLAAGLREAGFEVEIFDLATSRTDIYSRRLTSPRSWFRATLLAADPSETQLTHVGANGVELEPLRYLPRVELSAELNRFDLVQVVAGGPALALAAIRSRRPIVLQVATTVALERASQFPATGAMLARWRRVMTMAVSVMERIALQRADAVLVENRVMQEIAESASKNRVYWAPPGIDVERFAPGSSGWHSEGYLLSVCRLGDPRKGLPRLIRSYSEMRTLSPSVPALVLAGGGQVPADLLQLIAELGLAQFVSVRPDVLPADLPSLYREASVYLQASYEEGLGISAIEAMASGIPVVSTETAGSLETVEHGITGWLVAQDSDVERALATRTLSVLSVDGSHMSLAARSRAVALFSDRATLSHFIEVYKQLLGPDRDSELDD